MQSLRIYDELTAARTRFLRVDELCRLAAEKGALPSAEALAAEARLPLKEKKGLERAHGLFLADILSNPVAGTHLCHAMLLPLASSKLKLEEYREKGEVDLGAVHLKRHGKASFLTCRNPRYLNAEDETTLEATEMAVDLALLDPETEVCVLRGDVVMHANYAGRRLFGAGINLTHLYEGKIRYLWYLIRDLGFVNKLYRGLAVQDQSPEDRLDGKAVDRRRRRLRHRRPLPDPADDGLHHRRAGRVPHAAGAQGRHRAGAANLRLPRFVGDRIARQAILAERRIDCDSTEGRMICDEIVPPQQMDHALAAIVEKLTSSGVVSAAGNRRAFRAGEEPLDDFRRYMGVYAREQAYCHFSPALVANLEKNWKRK